MRTMLALLVLAAGLPLAAQQYVVNPASAIPDNAPGIRSDIGVSGGPASITSFRVRLSITHPRVNDLSVWVVPPGLAISPPYTVASMTGSGAYMLFQSIGQGRDLVDVQFTPSTDPGFAMGVSLSQLFQAGNPTTGLYTAPGLQNLLGTNANGTWGLVVVDQVGSQAGRLDTWGIDFARPGINVWEAPTPPSPWALKPGTFHTALRLELVAPAGPQSLVALSVQRLGTCSDADIAAVRLIRDTDFNGYADTYDPQLDTDQVFSSGVASFPSCGLNVNQGRAHVLVQINPAASGASLTAGVQVSPAGFSVSAGPLYAGTISSPLWPVFGRVSSLPWVEDFDTSPSHNISAHTASGPAPAASATGGTVGSHSYTGGVADGRLRITQEVVASQAPVSTPNHLAMDYRIFSTGMSGWSAAELHFDLSAHDPATETIALGFRWASIREAITPGDGVFLSDDGGATWFGCAWKFPMVTGTVVPYQAAALDLSAAVLFYGRSAFGAAFAIRFQVAGTAMMPNGGILLDDIELSVAASALRVREQNASGVLILNGEAASGARDFGQQPVPSGPSAALTIHVANPGSAAVTLALPTVSPTGQFVVDTTGFSTSLAPGAATTFQVRFDPSSLGAKSAEVVLTHNAAGTSAPFRFGVAGEGVAGTTFEVRLGSTSGTLVPYNTQLYDFGYQSPAAGPTTSVTVFVVNPSAQAWTLGIPQLTGTHAAQFLLDTSGFSTSLAVGGSTSFSLAFDPASPGAYSATLSFSHNSAGAGGPPNPFVATVAGYGSGPVTILVREQYVGNPISNGDAASGLRDFGNHNIGAGPTAANQFSIHNTGQNVLTVSAITLSGSGASQYQLSAPATATQLAPGQYFGFTIAFDPSTVGAAPALVSFTHNAVNTGSPFSFDITGVGVVEPILEVRDNGPTGPVIAQSSAPANGRLFGFRDVSAGPSAYAVICVRNLGNGDLILGTPTPSNAAWVLDLSTFSTTVTPGSFTEFGIAFDPVTIGSAGGGVYFSHNAAGGSFSINTDGTGTSGPLLDVRQGGPTGPQVGTLQAWQDFGNVDVSAGPTSALVLYFQNEGSATLTLSTPFLTGSDPGEFVLDATGFASSLAPGASTTLTIAFDPTQTGVKSCFVSVAHNSVARYNSPLLVPFLGTGISTTPVPEVQVRIGSTTGTVVGNGSPPHGALTYVGRDIAAGPSTYLQIFILNIGQSTLSLGTPTAVSGLHFVIDASATAASLTPGANTSFGIAFDPASVGTLNDTIEFVHNGINTASPFTFSVQGEGLAVGVLEVREATTGGPVIAYGAAAANGRAFGLQELSAGPTTPLTIVLMNVGSASIQLGMPAFNPTTTEFTLNATGFVTTLGAGASTSFTVSFDPTSTGPKTAPVAFTHDAVWPASGVTTFWFEVSGTGIPDNSPVLSVREGSTSGAVIAYGSSASGGRDLGTQNVNAGPTAGVTIVLVNNGTGPLFVGTPELASGSGYNPSQFVLDLTGLPASVAAGASASFAVAFDPSTAGQHVGLVRFTHNSGFVLPSPFLFEVTGLGTGVGTAPVIEVRDNALSGPLITNNAAPSGGRAFADRLLDSGASTPVVVYIRNTGAGDLNLGTPALMGADAAEFVLDTTGFAAVVSPGSHTTFSVAFDPASAGAKSARIEFTHDAPFTTSSPFVLNLSGTGITSVVTGPSGGAPEEEEDSGCVAGTTNATAWGLALALTLALFRRHRTRSRRRA